MPLFTRAFATWCCWILLKCSGWLQNWCYTHGGILEPIDRVSCPCEWQFLLQSSPWMPGFTTCFCHCTIDDRPVGKVSEEAHEYGLCRPWRQQITHCDQKANALLPIWWDSNKKSLLSFTNFSSKTSNPSLPLITSTQLLLLRTGTFSASMLTKWRFVAASFRSCNINKAKDFPESMWRRTQARRGRSCQNWTSYRKSLSMLVCDCVSRRMFSLSSKSSQPATTIRSRNIWIATRSCASGMPTRVSWPGHRWTFVLRI